MLPTLLGQSLQLSPLMSRFEQSGIKLELLCHSFSRTLTAKGNSCGLGFFFFCQLEFTSLMMCYWRWLR